MPVNLKGRSFLTLMDFSPLEIRYLLDLSADLKAKKRSFTLSFILAAFMVAGTVAVIAMFYVGIAYM